MIKILVVGSIIWLIHSFKDRSMETLDDTQMQTQFTADDCRYIITANPGNEKLLASLGLDSNTLHVDDLFSIYRTWEAHNRFFPPDVRSDNMDYYEFIACKFNNLIRLIKDTSNDLDVNELLEWVGELKPLANNIDAGVPLFIEDYRCESDLIKGLTKKSLISGGWITYIKDKERNSEDVYYTRDSIDKPLVTWIKSLVSNLTDENHESYTQNMQFLNSTLNGEQSYIQPLQILLDNSISGRGDLISSVELLYCLININTWAYHNNPGTDFRIGPSAGSMLIFNSILISIGYNPIPIYAIDFAAYSLDQEGFTAYILFIMSKVEGQEIRHELPPSLFEALNRDSGI